MKPAFIAIGLGAFTLARVPARLGIDLPLTLAFTLTHPRAADITYPTARVNIG